MINVNLNNIPEPANRIINDLVKGIDLIAPDLIRGIYITGSIPLQDFHPEKSDIDFVITCDNLPNETTASKLKQLHQQIQKRYPKPDLSGYYVTTESLHTKEISAIKILSWHEGSMRFQNFEMTAVSLYELKTNAVTMFGKNANELTINIDANVLNDFMHQNINDYWQKWITQHSNWFQRKIILFLFPRFTEWAVLGVARQLCTLQTGKIASKIEAGNYCLKKIPAEFHAVVIKAIQIRKDKRTYPVVKSYAIRPSFRRLRETIDCVNFVIGEFNRGYRSGA